MAKVNALLYFTRQLQLYICGIDRQRLNITLYIDLVKKVVFVTLDDAQLVTLL